MNNLEFFFEEIEPLKIDKKQVKKYIQNLVNSENKKLGEISVIFCSDDYLLKINREFLQHDFYTDIVTFNYVKKNVVSGDLFISIDRVIDNAKHFKTKNKEELMRVIFHGVLHLVGYNDKEEEEKKIMREKENHYLKEVDFNGIEI